MKAAFNLDKEVQKVWSANTVDEKREALRELIKHSRAKAETKRKAFFEIDNNLKSAARFDKYAAGYILAGMGLKVT